MNENNDLINQFSKIPVHTGTSTSNFTNMTSPVQTVNFDLFKSRLENN